MLWFKKSKKEIKSFDDIHKNRRLKIGLALGGGGARGFAHIGAIKAFEEYGIKFDFVSGTSAGSLVGAMLASGMSSEKMIEIASSIKEKDIRTSKLVLIPSKTTGLENIITSYLGDIGIEDLPIPFAPVVVDLVSTDEIALRKGNLAKAVAGSCAVPGVFTPVEYEGKLLADGGLLNTIPSDVPKLFGCDYVVAVDVNSTRTYGTTSTKILDVMGASIRILMKSNAIKGYVYGEVIIQPSLQRFKSTRLDGYEEMIEEGYKATKEHIGEILELWTRKPLKKKKKLFKVEKNKNKVMSDQFDPSLITPSVQQEAIVTREGDGTIASK